MEMRIRRAAERGTTRWDWLQSHHTFSFGEYHDPAWNGFRSLRVINEDWVQPGQGFGLHPHANMEILSYVVKGTLAHRDSLGNQSHIHAGELQRMSAGTGVLHSEFNPSVQDPVHFLQIWLHPETRDLSPSYEQKSLPAFSEGSSLQEIAAPKGALVRIHQDVRIYRGSLQKGQSLSVELAAGRALWIQLVQGALVLQPDVVLEQGDGVGIAGVTGVQLSASSTPNEWLLFDLA